MLRKLIGLRYRRKHIHLPHSDQLLVDLLPAIRCRLMDLAAALRHFQVRRRVNRLSRHVHLEIQMGTQRDTGVPHYAELLACRDAALTIGERRRDHSEMAVDAQKAVMLDQHFETTRTLVLNADHRARGGCQNRCTVRCRQINPVVVGAGLRLVWQHTRAEWR